MSKSPRSQLLAQLGLMTLARLCLNTGLRMVYPFAPAFARGLGVPIDAIYRLILIRSFAGFLSPLFSPLSEKYGRVPVMVGSMLIFGFGCLVVVVRPTYAALGITLCLISLAKIIYDPAMQSYVGERVPYAQRGRAISVTELSWAGALLIGGPLLSLTIARQGWLAPFFWLGLLGVLAALAVWRGVSRIHAPAAGGAVTLRQAAHTIRRHRVIWAAMAYIALTMTASETLLIVFGDWMESTFGLGLLALGFSAGVIGLAEATGELSTGWAVDHFGKRPVIISTGLLNALTMLLLPFVSVTLPLAQVAYFAVFFLFEMTVVGSMPLMTELLPSARAVVMSAVIAAMALGRVAGAWLGPQLFATWGFAANGVAACVLMGTAVLILALWVYEYEFKPTSTAVQQK
ncbi:MAG: MFS transporter [Anaerolineae bacterium]|nr:MFS transporter [Anaerolineae bacterium]